jgi:SAM-dependent methyltransferase
MTNLNTQFWNERYADSDYVYGTEPNEYLRERLAKLSPGKILFPCEGEGRNSVYAAGQGWDSVGFDSSSEGQKKALRLATERKVSLRYEIYSVLDYPYPEAEFDAVGIFYAHMPSSVRKTFYHNLIQSLKPGGAIILEVFDKDQLGRPSGGPQDIDMLCTPEILAEDFKETKILELKKEIISLEEGKFHRGEAVVLRLFARK